MKKGGEEVVTVLTRRTRRTARRVELFCQKSSTGQWREWRRVPSTDDLTDEERLGSVRTGSDLRNDSAAKAEKNKTR